MNLSAPDAIIVGIDTHFSISMIVRLLHDILPDNGLRAGACVEVYEGAGSENVEHEGQKWVRCPVEFRERTKSGAERINGGYVRLEPHDYEPDG